MTVPLGADFDPNDARWHAGVHRAGDAWLPALHENRHHRS